MSKIYYDVKLTPEEEKFIRAQLERALLLTTWKRLWLGR